MWQYIGKHLLLMIPTLAGAALVIFLLMHIIPGDIALLIIGGDQGGDINPQELAKLRVRKSDYQMLKSIEAPDRDIVVFHLRYPSASFLKR